MAALLFVASACGGSPNSTETATTTPLDAAPTTTATRGPLTATTAEWKLDQAWSRAVVLDDHGQLLVYSGLDAAKRSLSRVTRLDPTTGHPTDAAKLPKVLHDAAGTSLGEAVLLFGGGEQEAGVRDITAVTGAQAGKVIGHLPEARSDLAAFTLNNTAYIIGGYDGTTLPTAVLATTDGVTLTKVGDLNPGVRYPAVAAADGRIYVFGGKTASGQTDAIQMCDPATHTITTIGHFPAPIGHAVAFTLGGTIYVAGGRVSNASSDSGNNISSQVWSFDPAGATVTPAGTLPYGVADTGAATIGPNAYIVGGENQSDAALATVTVLHH